jgi:hypothetical protein
MWTVVFKQSTGDTTKYSATLSLSVAVNDMTEYQTSSTLGCSVTSSQSLSQFEGGSSYDITSQFRTHPTNAPHVPILTDT